MSSGEVPRFDNSPDLFGSGGQSSQHALNCDWCSTVHNADFPFNDSRDGDPEGEESVCFTHFGGKQICVCCFGKIEQAILVRMSDIIPWFVRIINAKEKQTQSMRDLIAKLESALNANPEADKAKG